MMSDRERERLIAEQRDAGHLAYEKDENGEFVLVKSIESTAHAFLRFSNRTPRPVDVWWRNFQGIRKHYIKLQAGSYYDINSYISHVWEFSDAVTRDICVINNRPVFRPPLSIANTVNRTNWNITIRVRSLRESVLQVLALRYKHPDAAHTLGLPRVLADELHRLITLIHGPFFPSTSQGI